MATLKADKRGVARIKQARIQNGRAIDDPYWLVAASQLLKPSLQWQEAGPFADGISLGTWKRFLGGNERINAPAFQSYCKVLGLNWQDIVEPNPNIDMEPELPVGPVPLTSSFYIERPPIEFQCHQAILQPGALLRIKAPRQMGKTSLMDRILYKAREKSYRTVKLSFQSADEATFASLDTLLRWFCNKVGWKLQVPSQADDCWTNTFGSKDNCTAYFEECLLLEADTPLVLGLDEVDRVFQHPEVARDFFGLLRAWHEEPKYGDRTSATWAKLRLVMAHSTEIYIPLGINESPFNVGLPIELPEFNLNQMYDLAQRYGLNWDDAQVERLTGMVGGHPYLVRVGLYYMTQQNISLEQLLQTAPTEAEPYGEHLRRHLRNLKKHPELIAAFSEIVTANAPVEIDSELEFQLYSMGLVVRFGNGLEPRCDLYRQYFRSRLRGT